MRAFLILILSFHLVHCNDVISSLSLDVPLVGVKAIALVNNYLFVCSESSKIIQIDPTTGYIVRTFTAHIGGCTVLVTYNDKLASGGNDGLMKIWDLSTGISSVQIPNLDYTPIDSLAINSDYLFFSANSNPVRKVSLKTGQTVSLIGHTNIVTKLLISGRYLYSGSKDKTVKQWDLTSLSSKNDYLGLDSAVNSIWVDDTKGSVYAGSVSGSLEQWETATSSQTASGSFGAYSINSIVTMGDYIFFACSDSVVYEVSYSDLSIIRTFKGHTSSVIGLAIDTGLSILYSSSFDSILKWDLISGNLIQSFYPGLTNYITKLYICNSSRLLSIDSSSSVIIWNLESGIPTLQVGIIGTNFKIIDKKIYSIVGQSLQYYTIDSFVYFTLNVLPNVPIIDYYVRNNILILAFGNMSIGIYDMAGSLLKSLNSFTEQILMLNAAENSLVVGHANGTVTFWNIDTFEYQGMISTINVTNIVYDANFPGKVFVTDPLHLIQASLTSFTIDKTIYVSGKYPTIDYPFLYLSMDTTLMKINLLTESITNQVVMKKSIVSLAANDSTLFIGTIDGKISFYAFNSLIDVLEDNSNFVCSKYIPKYGLLLVGSADGSLSKLNVSSNILVNRTVIHDGSVIEIEFDNNFYYTVGKDFLLKKWTLKGGYLMKTWNSLSNKPLSLALGLSQIYVGTEEANILVLNYISDKVQVFSGHEDAVTCVLENNYILYSGSKDKQIISWDPDTGEVFYVFNGHDSTVTSLHFSGQHLISGSLDQTAIVWDMNTQTPYKIFSESSPILKIGICGQFLLLAKSDNSISSYSLNNFQMVHKYDPAGSSISGLDCSNNSTLIVTYENQEYDILKLSFSPVIASTSLTKNQQKIIISNNIFTTILSVDSSAGSPSKGPLIGIISALVFVAAIGVFVACLRYRRFNKEFLELDMKRKKVDLFMEARKATDLLELIQILNLEFPEKPLGPEEFKIKKDFGKNGNYTVHLADAFSDNAKKFGKDVVVKKLGEAFALVDDKQKIPFAEEISILNYLRDKSNVNQLVGFCENPAAIVMKYYPLGALNYLLNSKKPLSKKLVFTIAYDVALGLRSIHEALIAHCDIKPQNIMMEKVDNNRMLYIISEFSNANLISEKAREMPQKYRSANLKTGSSGKYAAPEAFQRFKTRNFDSTEIMKAGDIYSYGPLIYELLHRKQPWA